MTWDGRQDRAPEGTLASILAAASDVFGTQVSATDNFFTLGGDSVLVLELAARIEDRVGAEVNVEMIFYTDDMAHFARSLDEYLSAAPGAGE